MKLNIQWSLRLVNGIFPAAVNFPETSCRTTIKIFLFIQTTEITNTEVQTIKKGTWIFVTIM